MLPPDPVAKSSWTVTLASIAMVVAALYFAKGLLIPLTLSVLLSFMLSPLCDWLERWRLGRIPAVLVTVSLGFTLLGIMAWTSAVQVAQLAPKLPEYQHNVEAKLRSVNDYAVAVLSKVTQTAQGIGQNTNPMAPADEPRGTSELPFSVRVLSSPTSPIEVFGGLWGTLLEVLGTIGIVIILVIFFLARREDLRDRFIRLVDKGDVTVTTQMLEDASARVSRYLSMLFIINATYGMAVGIGLYLIGVPNATLWGILAATLRFIPYIGPWIAAAMPIGLAMAVSTGWIAPLLTVGLFVVLELISNNLMEPWLYGKNTGVSAVAVLVAAVFWMWLWGPIGLLLATPLTVCVLVIGKHVPQLSSLDILLGNEPVFEPKTRIYQRLLAGDQEEAVELFEELLAGKPLVEVYDKVLLPALAMAETHWQLGELNESRHKFMLESLKEMIQDRRESQLEIAVKTAALAAVPDLKADAGRKEEAPSPWPSILCLPARTEADEIAALMLAHALETSGYSVQTVSVSSLASDLAGLELKSTADVVFLSATPPAALMHARYLCKRIRSKLPNVNLVVGLWDAHGDLIKASERIGHRAVVVATLADAQEQIRLLASTCVPPTANHSSEKGSPQTGTQGVPLAI